MKSIIAQELQRIGASSPVAFEVTFADGETYRNRAGPPAFSLRFRNRAAEMGIAAFGHIGMCDAYFDGDLDVEGDLRRGVSRGDGQRLRFARMCWSSSAIAGTSFATRTRVTRTRQGECASALRIGAPILSTLARRPADDVHVRLLAGGNGEPRGSAGQQDRARLPQAPLAQGETVVDIGCGFGGFMFHVAPRYGVHITGTNTTTEQVAAVAR